MKKIKPQDIIDYSAFALAAIVGVSALIHIAGCVSLTNDDIKDAGEIATSVITDGLTDETLKKAKELVDSVADRGTVVTTPTSIVWVVKEPGTDAPHHVSGHEKDVGEAIEEAKEKPASSADATPFTSLDFCWGGFNGSKAVLADGCRIKDLSVSSNGLAYKWEQGGCELLGAANHTAADCLACFFCKVDGKWQGGKVDWLSTSRTTRDFKNAYEGYNGWDGSSIGKATEYAFVIVSRDGKKRSNVITCTK